MELDKFKLPKGAVIHYHGVPFRLEQDTEVAGRRENLDTVDPGPSEETKRFWRGDGWRDDKSLFDRVFGKWERYW